MKNRKWFDLTNTRCVVAGSEGLLGRSVCDALSDCGAEIDRIDSIGKDAKKKSNFHRVDLTNESELKDYFQTLKPNNQNWAFINCSYPRTENWGTLAFENVALEDFNKNTNMHLGSAFLFSQLAVKHLKKSNGGSIVNFGSIYGVSGPDLGIYDGTKMNNPSPYAAIKGGVNGLTRYIATAYGKNNIRANVVCPGGIFDQQPKSFVSAYEKRTPLGRMAKPDDISGVVAFLVSPAAKYMTGQILLVDGGWTAW